MLRLINGNDGTAITSKRTEQGVFIIISNEKQESSLVFDLEAAKQLDILLLTIIEAEEENSKRLAKEKSVTNTSA